MLAKKQSKKTNLNFKIFLTSIFLIFIFSLSISSNASASCGDGTIDSGEECDFTTNGLDSCRSKNSWCNNECKCQAWCVPNCECAKNLTAGQSCSDGCGQSCYGSIPKPANTCGNDIKEGSEECDFNSNFGPYPNQCANNGPCNQATCTCDTGNQNPAPTSSPTPSQNPIEGCTDTCYCATRTPIGQTCSDSAGNVTCDGTTSGMGIGNPTEYVTIHDRYVRAGTNMEDRNICGMPTGAYRKISAFAQTYEVLHNGHIPYMRMFIPPGTINPDFLIQEGSNKRMALTHYQSPPTANFPPGYDYISPKGSLADFKAGDYLSTQSMQGNLYVFNNGSLAEGSWPSFRGGWIYMKVSGGSSDVYYNFFTVAVDTEIYNDWWDHYGSNPDGSINWDKDVESVMTYVAPSEPTKTTPKTPTCKANFSKTDITAPGESKLSFSSENTTKLIGSCTGPWPIKELELPLSYTNYPFPFTINQTGTETCTFTPYNGTTKGESCSATVIVKKSTASTPTPTPSPAKPKPADYVTLHDAYTRAPEDKEYYSFTQNITTSHEYIPQFRAFIPPGTNYVNLIIKDYSDQSGSSWGGRKSVSRHILLPEASPEGDMPSEFIIGDYSTLTELIDHECWTEVNQMSALNIADESFSPPFLDIHRAGWLYAKVSSEYSTKYDTHFAVRVDTKTYNAWWDKYIKDEAGWNKYIENVETYIDPTTEIQTSPTPTPTPTQTPSLTATTSGLDANFTITNGTSCINYMCDTTTKTMVASEKDFKYQESFTCHYTKAGSYTASIECPNNNIITKVVTVKNPTQSSKACQRDNPDCEKSTCNNVYCFDGCERVKGTRVCDGS